MNNEQIILAVENYKFRIFDPVPKPEPGIAYILYQGDGKQGNMLIITSENPVLSRQIKAGGFDKKMTISTAVRECSTTKQVLDQSGGYRFIIYIDIFYKVRDIRQVFEQGCWNIDEIMENYVFQILRSVHRKYDIDDQIEIEDKLVEILPQKLKEKMGYLDITEYRVQVDIDERAKKVLDTSLDTMADTVVFEKERERGEAEVENKKQLEIKKLEAEEEVANRQNRVTLVRAGLLQELRDKIGEDSAVAFLAYERGEINGVELDDRIRSNQNAGVVSRIKLLSELVNLDALSGPALEQVALELIGQKDTGGTDTVEEYEGQKDQEHQEGLYIDSEEY